MRKVLDVLFWTFLCVGMGATVDRLIWFNDSDVRVVGGVQDTVLQEIGVPVPSSCLHDEPSLVDFKITDGGVVKLRCSIVQGIPVLWPLYRNIDVSDQSAMVALEKLFSIGKANE